MTALTDLATEIVVQLELLVASETVIDITNQRDDDSAKDSTILNAMGNHAARAVQRKLGRTVDNDDNDAVDFGVRIALLRGVAFYSATLTQEGMAYTAGVIREMDDEARARRQGIQSLELSLEDFVEEDARWPSTTKWDESVDG